MASVIGIRKSIRQRLLKKKSVQTLKKKLSYEEVIKRYEELSAR